MATVGDGTTVRLKVVNEFDDDDQGGTNVGPGTGPGTGLPGPAPTCRCGRPGRA